MRQPDGAKRTNQDDSADEWDRDLALLELDPTTRPLVDALRQQQLQLRRQNARLRELHADLAASHRRYRDLFDRGPLGHFSLTARGVIREMNEAAVRLVAQPADLLRDQNITIIVADEDRPTLEQCLGRVVARASIECEIALLASDGRRIPVQMSLRQVSAGDEGELLASVTDLRVQKRAQAQLCEARDSMRHLAHHDPLTGLPNRLLFNDRLEQALLRARRRMSRVGLLFIDIDRFKFVNDTLGHAVGDALLCEVASRLRASVRGEDTVARIAGDEFTVVLENIGEAQQATDVARKVLAALREPVTLDSGEIVTTASIGCALFPDHGGCAEELLRRADGALYAAKADGRDRVDTVARDASVDTGLTVSPRHTGDLRVTGAI